MKNILRSLFLSAAGMSSVGWIAVFFLMPNLISFEADDFLVSFFAEHLIMNEKIENFGETFAGVAEGMFELIRDMNITLIIYTIFMTLCWSAGSHYLNVDGPGKAKIYAIHWLGYTGAYVGILILIISYFTKSSAYEAADMFSSGGVFLVFLMGTIYYSLIYYVGVLLGTARFVRSSVLFANKLPGSDWL